jgi:Zn-dependent protease
MDPSAFENPKKGMGITAVAGPIANILISLILMIILKLLFVIFPITWVEASIFGWVIKIIYYVMLASISLAIFNLLPIPPLDGSKVIGMFLPDSLYYIMLACEKYIVVIVYILVFLGFFNTPITYLNGIVLYLLDEFTFFIPSHVNIISLIS